jgi:hypothetical protein
VLEELPTVLQAMQAKLLQLQSLQVPVSSKVMAMAIAAEVGGRAGKVAGQLDRKSLNLRSQPEL